MSEWQLSALRNLATSKLNTRVRFPSPAPDEPFTSPMFSVFVRLGRHPRQNPLTKPSYSRISSKAENSGLANQGLSMTY